MAQDKKIAGNPEKIKKVSIICAKGTIEDVYATLVLGNGARMEGIEANLFFTFFGMDAITKGRMNNLHTATVGNPALRLPWGQRMPKLMGLIPFIENAVSWMMRDEMDKKHDIPPVTEYLEMITASGGEVYACLLAAQMFKLKKEDLWEGVKDIITVGEFYERAAGGQIIFT
jgi:peroxiredoxin family protein